MTRRTENHQNGSGLDYPELFDLRGRSYDTAMRLFPDARLQEFMQVIDRADLKPGMHVADVPAGGGYLAEYLPRGCYWHGHEPSTGFDSTAPRHGGDIATTGFLPLPWGNASMDAAISLAGVHHMADKAALFREVRRIVRPGGCFVLSDVAKDSPQALFLDGYVNTHNSTGHHGLFLDSSTEAELEAAGWHCQSSQLVEFSWLFDNREAMGEFCRRLFDLRKGTPEETIDVIAEDLGIEERGGGRIGMRWALRTIVAA
jgi:SAM-dependent methyltransferase